MAEIRINATGGVKLYDADDSHYAQIIAGTITSNTDVMTFGHAAVVMGTKLDCNGNNLILDADADTYLDPGTDDTIKFYVSGAHDLTISANAINVLSGTTLTIDSGATIANSGTATGFSSADPASADGDALGTASLEWSDLYLADSSVIYFGADQDTTLTHTDGTGLTLNSTNKLTFGDVASYINQSSDGVLTIAGEATIDLTASTAVLVSNDLKLDSDSSVIGFGADNDTTLTHTDGTGLTLNSTNKLTFGDAASFIQQSSDGVLRIDGEATVDINASAAVTIAAERVPVTVGGIPFYADTTNASIYTFDVSGTESTAANNTAYGLGALNAVTTGDYNICLGGEAGGAIDTGATNLFIGYGAGDGFDAETFNMGIGFDALGGPVAGGEYNCAIGHYTGDAISSGDKNTCVGYNAGGAISTGDRNTIIGYGSTNVNTGSNCIVVGAECGMNPTSGDNGLIFGNSITGAVGDFQFGVGGVGVVLNDFDTDADWSRTSDERIKRNIEDSTLGLDFINDLRTVKFQWKPSNEVPKELKSEYSEENKKNLDVTMHGFIAQEVKEAIDKHGDTTFGGWHLDESDGVTQRTKKNMFIMPLVNAVKELSSQVTTLQEEVKTLKGE